MLVHTRTHTHTHTQSIKQDEKICHAMEKHSNYILVDFEIFELAPKGCRCVRKIGGQTCHFQLLHTAWVWQNMVTCLPNCSNSKSFLLNNLPKYSNSVVTVFCHDLPYSFLLQLSTKSYRILSISSFRCTVICKNILTAIIQSFARQLQK